MNALELSRSLFYYHENKDNKAKESTKRGRPSPGFSVNEKGHIIPDEQIEEFLMEAVESEQGVYGYRKLTEHLRKEHKLIINPKKVYRLCDKLDILLPKRNNVSPYPRNLAKQHVITAPNQLWQLDVKYGSIEETGKFVFLASAIDVFDRKIVGYYRGAKCQATDITTMLTEAFITRNIPIPKGNNPSIIIRTDNGPQFVSKHFGEFCSNFKIYHERIPPKSPNLNAYIESFHSIIERECYQQHTFSFYEEAYYWIDKYMDFYNNRRYHGSLKYMSPNEFYELYKGTEYPKEMALRL